MEYHWHVSTIRPSVRRILRILWNIASLAETARQYPDVALRRVWERIPPGMRATRPARACGTFLHHRACARQQRTPLDTVFHTFFLRKRSPLRSAPAPHARAAALLSRTDRLCEDSPVALFSRAGDNLTISPRLMAGVSWVLADARDPRLPEKIGSYQVVMANNILCHMYDPEAAECLRNIAALVAPGGHLFTYGVDLDVKSRVVRSLGFVPVDDMIEDVYLADSAALAKWPFRYWGREPRDKRRREWALRYAAVYQRPG